jgi:hypothetical protein
MLMCMCMLNKRTQILFDQSLWQMLLELAKNKKISIGQLVREAVKERFDKEYVLEQREKAIESTLSNRLLSKKKIDYKKLINYGRKY